MNKLLLPEHLLPQRPKYGWFGLTAESIFAPLVDIIKESGVHLKSYHQEDTLYQHIPSMSHKYYLIYPRQNMKIDLLKILKSMSPEMRIAYLDKYGVKHFVRGNNKQ